MDIFRLGMTSNLQFTRSLYKDPIQSSNFKLDNKQSRQSYWNKPCLLERQH